MAVSPGSPYYLWNTMLQIHASLGTFYVSLVLPRSHNKLQFRWLLRLGQSQRFLLKIYFHFAKTFRQHYRLRQKNSYSYQGDRSRDQK